MDDLLTEFLTETSGNLAVLDVELVKFEQDSSNNEILSNIFRLVHTIKGTSGFLGLPRLEAVAHAGEDVLGKFRDGELEVTPDAVTLVLQTIDTIRDLLGGLEEAGSELEGDDSGLIGKLRAMADGEAPTATVEPEAEEAPEAPEAVPSGPVLNEQGFPVAAELLEEVMAAEASGAKASSEADLAAEMGTERGEESGSGTEANASVPAEVKNTAPSPAAENGTKESAIAQQTIRVNVDLLENLMTLVSELVLTRNALNQMVRGREDSEFNVPFQRLSHITSDLQEGVMKTRMQPIGNAWAKLPRIVRDLALEANKKIDLQMVGAETELDRQVLELIKDPLTHMVRNSADHGLETPDERQEAGKPETGVVLLQAFHEGGHIVIEISDDGRGLNMDRIKANILENGLATSEELENMQEQQIQQFIFNAGFSTAEKVTSVSGRGVGMDVVRTNIEKIGGTIELTSIVGKGSTFTIKIPLTLAIVSALIVECTNQRFAIPQISVLELVRASAHSENAIEMINNAPVLRLRNRLLPLVQLSSLLNLDGAKEHGPDDEAFIIVSQVGNYTFGIIVDRVFDTEEIVVKPVAPILRDINLFSGNTILGDGSVIMILDPSGIASATGEMTMGAAKAESSVVAETAANSDRQAMLVFKSGGESLKAVPLALVARLEEIDLSTVEYSNAQRVVQYRGQLMPLIPYNEDYEWKSEGMQSILVFTDKDRSMGLVVEEIIDIVEDEVKVELRSSSDGLVGSAVINGKATDIIDAGYYLTIGF
jgi:two-component system chemotaxis sensor kinase CheA